MLEEEGKIENEPKRKFLHPPPLPAACDEGAGICSTLLVIASCILIAATLPLSLFFVVKVVQVVPFP